VCPIESPQTSGDITVDEKAMPVSTAVGGMRH
jgi:hypothetical protein